MSHFEIISTVLVWALVPVVFWYYRSLEIRHQGQLDSDRRRVAAATEKISP